MESRFLIHGESLSTMESRFQLDTQFKIDSIQNISELHKSYLHKLYTPIFLNAPVFGSTHIHHQCHERHADPYSAPDRYAPSLM